MGNKLHSYNNHRYAYMKKAVHKKYKYQKEKKLSTPTAPTTDKSACTIQGSRIVNIDTTSTLFLSMRQPVVGK